VVELTCFVQVPGYGCSPGRSTEQSIDKAIEEGYRYARQNGFEKIVLVGRSLGCGPVARLARKLSERSAKEFYGLILWSSIISVRNSCANLTSEAFSRLIAERWAPIDDLKLVMSPILFITGEKDSLTTLDMCRQLRTACYKAPYTFQHTSETADHNANWDFLLDLVHPMQGFMKFLSQYESGEAVDEDEELNEPWTHEVETIIPQTSELARYAISSGGSDDVKILVIGCGPVGR
jgi:acetyl esterase/lipase